MIVYKGPGDIFKVPVELRICPVNVMGIMGNGLALAFKFRYPDVYARYRYLCLKGLFQVDQILVVGGVVCFPTKREFFYDSKVEYIENNLKKLVDYCNKEKIKTLAIPAVGCGKGNLDFSVVEALIEQYLGKDFTTNVWFLTKK